MTAADNIHIYEIDVAASVQKIIDKVCDENPGEDFEIIIEMTDEVRVRVTMIKKGE